MISIKDFKVFFILIFILFIGLFYELGLIPELTSIKKPTTTESQPIKKVQKVSSNSQNKAPKKVVQEDFDKISNKLFTEEKLDELIVFFNKHERDFKDPDKVLLDILQLIQEQNYINKYSSYDYSKKLLLDNINNMIRAKNLDLFFHEDSDYLSEKIADETSDFNGKDGYIYWLDNYSESYHLNKSIDYNGLTILSISNKYQDDLSNAEQRIRHKLILLENQTPIDEISYTNDDSAGFDPLIISDQLIVLRVEGGPYLTYSQTMTYGLQDRRFKEIDENFQDFDLYTDADNYILSVKTLDSSYKYPITEAIKTDLIKNNIFHDSSTPKDNPSHQLDRNYHIKDNKIFFRDGLSYNHYSRVCGIDILGYFIHSYSFNEGKFTISSSKAYDPYGNLIPAIDYIEKPSIAQEKIPFQINSVDSELDYRGYRELLGLSKLQFDRKYLPGIQNFEARAETYEYDNCLLIFLDNKLSSIYIYNVDNMLGIRGEAYPDTISDSIGPPFMYSDDQDGYFMTYYFNSKMKIVFSFSDKFSKAYNATISIE